MRVLRLLFSLAIAGGLAACSPSASSRTTASVVESLHASAACVDFSARLTANLQRLLLDNQQLPTADQVRSELRARLGQHLGAEFAAEEVSKVYQTLVDESRTRLGALDSRDLLGTITALEIGDRTTPEKVALREKLDAVYALARRAATAAGLSCATKTNGTTAQAVVTKSKRSFRSRQENADLALPVQGALRVLATAYQSCHALSLPAMTSATDSIDGDALKYKGRYGKGRLYEVRSASLVTSTHYYLRDGIETGEACFDVTKKPMIYDFGGKPYADPGTGTTLDLFRNNPGGPTQSLGIDCSAFIFSSLATVGMKVRKGDMTPADVYGVSAAMLMNPAQNGLNCLEPVRTTWNSSLVEGDVLASKGHVVMIGHLGKDPWGTDAITSISDCTGAKLTSNHFDFEILQSAPVKGRVGIDRMRAADYLESSASMKTALQTYAVAACKAKFGFSGLVSPAQARLIRHVGTDECLSPEVPLERASCVQSCTENLKSWNELGGGFR